MKSTNVMIFFFFILTIVTVQVDVAICAPTEKPLWTKGKYYGGYPSADKYLTQGIVFEIAPDKKTMKEISIEFPADCYDENGNVSERSIHFSASEIEPLTLARHSNSQTLYFAYLDSFNSNWNTSLKMKWDRKKQSFKIQISTLTDVIEGTYCKADAILSKDAKKGKPRVVSPF